MTMQRYAFMFVFTSVIFVFFANIFNGWFLLAMSYFKVTLNKAMDK